MSNYLSVVSSLILQVRPESLKSVSDYLEKREHVEVHANDEFSKIVIVAEMENDIELSDFMSEMAKVGGVITVNMVFHHTDSAEDIEADKLAENSEQNSSQQTESVITFKEAKHHA